MSVKLGIFIVPDATDPAFTLEQVVAGDRSGLDLVGVQDHPHQRRFFDTWTLLSFVAARTQRIQLVTDVANLPLRPPPMLAKAAASLDLLSGGRFELGLGAEAFPDAVEAIALSGDPRTWPETSSLACVSSGSPRCWSGCPATTRPPLSGALAKMSGRG